MTYKLTDNPDIICRDDGAVIPRGHRWWDEYEQWCSEGNTAAPAYAPDTLELVRTELNAQVTEQRWLHESSGIELGGMHIATDISDQNRINTAITGLTLSGLPSVDFKAESGWISLDLADLKGIAAAITAHVQACFSVERAHHEAIEALSTLEDAQAYDVTAGWP